MRYQISSFDLLKQMLSELSDDPSLPWNIYPCMEWPRSMKGQGYKTGKGYGAVLANGKLTSAHKLSYELANGPIGDGLDICHHCDNKPCFRPSHLYAATPHKNIQDAIERGHFRRADQRGSKNNSARLTEEQVDEIRKLRMDGWKLKPLGKRFGVAFSTIQRIVIGKNWNHGRFEPQR